MGKVTTQIDWPAVRKTRHLKRKLKPPRISRAVKYGLSFFNGLFWALSVTLIAAGYYSIVSSDTAAVRLTSVFSTVLNISVALLLIGVVMFVVSMAGILGALRENLRLLEFYRRCVVGFLCVEFGVAIFCLTFPSYVNSVVARDLPAASIGRYRDDANMQNLLDFLQQRFACCGVSDQGFLDWTANVYFNCSDDNRSAERCSVPWSCCLDPDRTPVRDTACGGGVLRLTAFEATKHVHTEGCIGAVTHWVRQHAYIVGASWIAVACAQGAVLYQASRICIVLERMRPRPPARPPRPALFSREMVVWSLRWATGGWPEEEEVGVDRAAAADGRPQAASGRHGRKKRSSRKRGDAEEGGGGSGGDGGAKGSEASPSDSDDSDSTDDASVRKASADATPQS